MEKSNISQFRLGIIAGGQLGKMLAQAASNWDVKTYVLDPSASSPAVGVCTGHVKGDGKDFTDVYNFGKQVDLLTFEVEDVNIEALYKLEEEGLVIYPEPRVLDLIKDKGTQKQFYKAHGIRTADFKLFDSEEEIRTAVESGVLKFPFVQKLRKSGYDGKGVAVINDQNDLRKLLSGPSVVEDKIRIVQEVALQVARSTDGHISAFPLVDLEFNEEANLVELLSCPSRTSEDIQNQAREVAFKIIAELKMTGLLAVEYFIDENGLLYVNEVSPRTHNSGHHTIESCITSQYEQQLRSVMGFPLGSTAIKIPSVMINLLGAPGFSGPARYHGLTECMSIDGIKIHIYGKTVTKPFRKMGHVTVLDNSLESAKAKAKQVQQLIRITT